MDIIKGIKIKWISPSEYLPVDKHRVLGPGGSFDECLSLDATHKSPVSIKLFGNPIRFQLKLNPVWRSAIHKLKNSVENSDENLIENPTESSV